MNIALATFSWLQPIINFLQRSGLFYFWIARKEKLEWGCWDLGLWQICRPHVWSNSLKYFLLNSCIQSGTYRVLPGLMFHRGYKRWVRDHQNRLLFEKLSDEGKQIISWKNEAKGGLCDLGWGQLESIYSWAEEGKEKTVVTENRAGN